MPSPFPGMDPFVETYEWGDFHVQFIGDVSDALNELVRPKYMARTQFRVYVERDAETRTRDLEPDSAVYLQPEHATGSLASAGSAVATLSPVQIPLPMPETVREAFLMIRETATRKLITVIELLSPSNKRRGASGRKLYLRKRCDVLDSDVNLVELDLLRRGRRMPTGRPLPEADYHAIVSRASRRPIADVFSWTLWDELPAIPIPLLEEDHEPTLDLQRVFTNRYESSGYAESIDYNQNVKPPLSDDDRGWLAQRLSALDADNNS